MNSVKNKPSYIRTDTSEIKESFFYVPSEAVCQWNMTNAMQRATLFKIAP